MDFETFKIIYHLKNSNGLFYKILFNDGFKKLIHEKYLNKFEKLINNYWVNNNNNFFKNIETQTNIIEDIPFYFSEEYLDNNFNILKINLFSIIENNNLLIYSKKFSLIEIQFINKEKKIIQFKNLNDNNIYIYSIELFKELYPNELAQFLLKEFKKKF